MDLKEKIKNDLSRYGFLLAIAGLVPIRSGFLLFQEKDCGCFLIEKSTLYAHNIFFGSISIVVGLFLVIIGITAYKEVSENTTKIWIIAFLVSGGIIGYSAGMAEPAHKNVTEGSYDNLTKSLTENGWIFFYANWCPHCHDQIELLGTSVKHLRMVDCGTVTCPSFVKSFPTWAKVNANGEVIEVKTGVQEIEALDEMAR
jgi:thiol-disulfide isomerase/thioredoxin